MAQMGKVGFRDLILAVVLLSTLSIWVAHGGTDFLPVPVEGELTAETTKVPVGQTVKISLTAVPQLDLKKLVLEVKLPYGLKLISGESHKVYENAQEGEHLGLKFQVQIVDTGQQRIVGSVTISDEPEFALRRAFVLDINPEKDDEPIPKRVRDSRGKGYVIY